MRINWDLVMGFKLYAQLLPRRAALLLSLLAFISLSSAVSAQYNDIRIVSERQNGGDGNGLVSSISLSGDGSLAVFSTTSTNLLNTDTNSLADVYLYTRSSGALTLVSVGTNGLAGNGASGEAIISADGSVVVFSSTASNLVSGDTNGVSDVFLYNVSSGETTLASRSSAAVIGNGASSSPSLSADGNLVVFQSDATNLVDNDTNSATDIFLKNQSGDTTTRLSLDLGGTQGDAASSHAVISADGTKAAFVSSATNLLPAPDSNGFADILIKVISSGVVTRASISSSLVAGNEASSHPALSQDGRYVAFSSLASNLVSADSNSVSDIFVHDTNTLTTTRVSLSQSGLSPNDSSTAPAISNSGRYVAFVSSASNLVNADTNNSSDIFVYDRSAQETARVSISAYGGASNGESSAPIITADGQYVGFVSIANNLVSGDNNGKVDAFQTNIECLVDLGSTTTDTDSDSVVNCSETCGNDATKTVPGICGCGVADTDTDSDGSADCNDLCDSDPAKIAQGSCGCGVADVDSNSNGVADCLDPNSSTVPSTPLIEVTGNKALVVFSGIYTGVKYRIVIKRNGHTVRTVSTRKSSYRIKNLTSGRYSLTYTISIGGVTSRSSLAKRFRIK